MSWDFPAFMIFHPFTFLVFLPLLFHFFLFSSPSHERFTKSACRKIKGGSSWYISLIKGENKIINISPMQKIHCTTPTRLGIFIHIFPCAWDTFVQLPSKNLLMYTRGGFILRGRFSLKCKRLSAAQKTLKTNQKSAAWQFSYQTRRCFEVFDGKFSNFEKSFLLILCDFWSVWSLNPIELMISLKIELGWWMFHAADLCKARIKSVARVNHNSVGDSSQFFLQPAQLQTGSFKFRGK